MKNEKKCEKQQQTQNTQANSTSTKEIERKFPFLFTVAD